MVIDERRNLLESLVRNPDGSIIVPRNGRILDSIEGLWIKLEDGIPYNDCDCVTGISKELGYTVGDKIEYTITVNPKK